LLRGRKTIDPVQLGREEFCRVVLSFNITGNFTEVSKRLFLDPTTLPLRGTARDWKRSSGKNEDTIRRACYAGRLAHTVIGGHRIIERRDFLDWLEAGYPRRGRPRKHPLEAQKLKEVSAPS
jgi:hypothetical protein